MKLDQFDFTTNDEFFKSLVDKALSGKHSEFEFIRNLDMKVAAKLYKKSTKKVAGVFENLRMNLVRQYQESVLNSVQNFTALLIIKQFENCRNFYLKESEIAKDMLKEFRCYVLSGHHILDQYLFSVDRPDFECVDYRKLPIKIF